ncbi:MAG: hypothetical protein HC942_26550 [Microcoleus sp. SU_5_6]|nr:hypothetical protein [Microcoleus sp. SU_5_6]
MLKQRISQIILSIAGLLLVCELISRTAAEILWFQEVGYLQVLLLRLTLVACWGRSPWRFLLLFVGKLRFSAPLETSGDAGNSLADFWGIICQFNEKTAGRSIASR